LRRVILSATGLALVALAALTYSTYRRDMREARSRIATGSEVVQTRCGLIEYASAGAGKPVLLVHGAGGGFDQLLEYRPALIARGFRVIAVSRFGYLRTPLPADPSAGAQADAHACLLDALGIDDRAAIVGVSAGAPSSMQFALRHADRCSALVLLVPAAYAPRAGGASSVRTPQGTPFLFATALERDFLFWIASRIARKSMIRSILGTPPSVVGAASASEQARVGRVLESILPVSSRRPGLLNDAKVTSSLPRYPLESISVPTLAISTADDLYGTYDGARYTAGHVPGARFVGLPDGGHLWVGHYDEVLAEITSFLDEAP
jgi:pimeloyl-ACP methyl ester carboxylesterase